MILSIEDLIAKRKKRWDETKDINLDKKIVNAIANKILDSPEILSEVSKKPYLLIECCFSIVDKGKNQVPFFLNDVQKDFINQIERYGTKKPYFILKGRQQGFTTLITAIGLCFAITRKNFAGFTLADRDDNTKAIFIDKAKVMYNFLPERLKPTEKFNSVNELYFDKLNSSLRVSSASSNVGRSRTLSFIHFSEVAFYKCALSDLQKSILEAATPDALCIYETTANGFNETKTLWESSSCVNLFYEWWRTKEYVSSEYEYLKKADTWLIKRLKSLKEKGLVKEQLTWYAKKYFSYIDKSSIKQEYPCTPEEAFVFSGDCVFDSDAISNYLNNFSVKSTLGSFKYRKIGKEIKDAYGRIVDVEFRLEEIFFCEDEGGFIRIVEHPKKDTVYVIGADTAGLGSDCFTAKVIDTSSAMCVATLQKRRIDEDLFAFQLYCLGEYYNYALIAVETNYSRHPVRVLRSLSYPNIYVSKSFTGSAERQENFYGFVTSSVTRPIIISNLVSVMRENIYLETDKETLKEMLSFTRHEDGKMAGAVGSHDDLVMASAIARYVALDVTKYEKNFPYTEQNDKFMEW